MKRAAVLLLIVVGFPVALHAESTPPGPKGSVEVGEGWSIEGGIGFTAGPDSFLMQLGAHYQRGRHFQWGRHFSLGPAFQIGVSDSTTIVAPTLDARLGFDLSSLGNECARRIEPCVSGGLGHRLRRP